MNIRNLLLASAAALATVSNVGAEETPPRPAQSEWLKPGGESKWVKPPPEDNLCPIPREQDLTT